MERRRVLLQKVWFSFLACIFIFVFERCENNDDTNLKKDISAIKIDNIISCTSNGLTVADSILYMQGGGSDFKPTKPDSVHYNGAIPTGMVWIHGGEFSMGGVNPVGIEGGGYETMNDARPVHRVIVSGFLMDATEVTNKQFAEFVKATVF